MRSAGRISWRRAYATALAVAVMSGFILPLPASAAITSVTLGSSNANQHGACPRSVQFLGTVSGSSGTSFSYQFVQQVNGVQTTTAPLAAKISTSGSFTASHSLTVSASATNPADNFVQMRASPILPLSSGSTISSKKVSFDIVCSGASASPSPPPSSSIPAPTDVRPVQSKADCVAALSITAFICDSLVKAGKLQLIWKEQAKRLDGYDVDSGGDHAHFVTRVTTQPPNLAPVRYAYIPRPSTGYDGNCYTVRAYRGTLTSAPSKPYCVTPGATATVTTYQATTFLSLVHWSVPVVYSSCKNSTLSNQMSAGQIFTAISKFGVTQLFPFLDSLGMQRNGSTRFGGTYVGGEAFGIVANYNGGPFSLCEVGQGVVIGYASVTARAGVKFNLGHLAHHTIYSATFTIAPSQELRAVASTFTLASNYSCATSIAAASHVWTKKNNFAFTGSSKIGLAQGAHTTVSADVTGIVSAWASHGNDGDNGFILADTAAEKGKPIFTYSCMTQFGDARLNVVSF